jgi:cytochrome b
VQLPARQNAERRVEVRDLPVRLFHWSLVLLVAFSWWAADQGGNWMIYHLWSGYAILTLIVFRVGRGFVGSAHARFSDFLYSPRATLGFIKSLPRREPVDYAGYNPLGGIKILVLLLCVLVQALTGLFANDDIVTEGPLFHWVSKETSDWLTTVHKKRPREAAFLHGCTTRLLGAEDVVAAAARLGHRSELRADLVEVAALGDLGELGRLGLQAVGRVAPFTA